MVSPMKRSPILGGPGSSLPFAIESFLSWTLCVSCLSISGYHYVVSTFLTPRIQKLRRAIQSNKYLYLFGSHKQQQTNTVDAGIDGNVDLVEYWLPLTITSRSERDRANVRQRHDQLLQLLQALSPPGVTVLNANRKEIINMIRSNEMCRRLSTLVMRPYSRSSTPKSITNQKKSDETPSSSCASFATSRTNILLDFPELELPKILASIWSDLLLLPNTTTQSREKNDTFNKSSNNSYMYSISMIVPAFREKGIYIRNQLEKALINASNPNQIEVVIVDAGMCHKLQEQVELLQNNTQNANAFGKIICVEFKSGGGRGPCLNFGANASSGQILTFCHSDTTLPQGWDTRIISTLFPYSFSSSSSSSSSAKATNIMSNSCAFSFGIDTSLKGLAGADYDSAVTSPDSATHYYPPGIKAVETTANIRSHMYSLPYGDQVISIPSAIFHYIGGYPDQCLMEDYELVDLLRKRAALLPHFVSTLSTSTKQFYPNPMKERLAIIGGKPALCSPRRWQKFGVLYVTFMNSKFVNLYAGGLSPDGLFRLYYGSDAPPREHDFSLWEMELRSQFQIAID